jgi:hypothetical protein
MIHKRNHPTIPIGHIVPAHNEVTTCVRKPVKSSCGNVFAYGILYANDLIEVAMARRTKKIGSRLSRSEIVTVRLDPKLRYVAELAARKQRRTLSSFIEWAVEQSLATLQLSSAEYAEPAWKESDSLWDVDEADRFVKLAVHYPDLLTHEEQVLWKVIRESGYFWKGRHDKDGVWIWNPSATSVIFDRVRDEWDTLKAIAGGDRDTAGLIPVIRPKEPDDIPF